MAVVAVAGGTDGLALTIVEALAVHGGHDVVILSRRSSAELQKNLPFRVVKVDYSDVNGLAKILESNNVGTVISGINSLGETSPERNLVQAAEKSSKTTRFIPSTFAGFNYPEKYADSAYLAKIKFEVIEELRKTSLTYTSIICGTYLDYYGSPLLQSNAHRCPMFVDMENKQAAIPGTGTESVIFTTLVDIARFIVRALDLSDWPTESYTVGDRVTLLEFVKLAEEARGCKFEVHFDSKEALEAGQLTDLPCYTDNFYERAGKELGRQMITQVGLWTAAGEMDGSPKYTLNQAFPDIKPMTVKEFMDLSWKV